MLHSSYDLRVYYSCVEPWFRGEQVYGVVPSSDYPPASFAILQPLTWIPLQTARWFWLVSTLALLVWISAHFVKESCSSNTLQRTFVLLWPWSTYGTLQTLGEGNLGNHAMMMAFAALYLSEGGLASRSRSVVVVALFLVSLAKPTVSAPFLLLAAIRQRSVAIFVGVVLAYGGLTVYATSCQEGSTKEILVDWMQSEEGLGYGTSGYVSGGYLHLSHLLYELGTHVLHLPIALALLLLAALWMQRYRDSDFWPMVGVVAVFARLFVYHASEDDLLILLPLVSLFRTTNLEHHTPRQRCIAEILVVLTLAGILAPGHLHNMRNQTLGQLFLAAQFTIWISDLVFLGLLCRTSAKRRQEE